MGIFDQLFGKKAKALLKNEQAVIIHLDGMNLPDEIYATCDLMTLEEKLQSVVRDGLGEYDGNESGPGETLVYLYGPDAELLFAAIEPVLREYPLCRNAKVIIRRGSVGASQREVRI